MVIRIMPQLGWYELASLSEGRAVIIIVLR
jgi:hypothetical protein